MIAIQQWCHSVRLVWTPAQNSSIGSAPAWLEIWGAWVWILIIIYPILLYLVLWLTFGTDKLTSAKRKSLGWFWGLWSIKEGGRNVTVRLVWIPGSDSSVGRAPQTRDSVAIVQIAICSVIISPISTPGTDSLTLAWGKNLGMYLQGWRSFKTPVTPELHP